MNYFPIDFFESFARKSFFAFLLILALFTFSSINFAQEEDAADAETDPVALFNQGQEAHEKGDLPNAIKFYDEALKFAPEFPEAEYQKGNALVSLGKTAEAEKSFRRAVELREDWTLAMAALGSLLVRNKNYTEAEKFLNKAVELDPLNFPALTALTDLRLQTKADTKTLQELYLKVKNLTEKANPTSAIWASRGAIENALGDKTAAKTSLNRALAITPNNEFALVESANIALSEGDTTRAKEILKTLAQIAPTAQSTQIINAGINLAEGKQFEALKILDAIANPNAEVLTMRVKIVANSSLNIPDLEKRLADDPKNATVLSRLCTLLRVENPAKALSYCQRAAEAEPDNINHAVGYGAALVQAQKYAEAANLLTRLKSIAPDNATVRSNLATAFYQLKRWADAKNEYLWLTEKQPNLAIAFFLLATAHDQLGEYLDAAANYQQFLRIADAEKSKLEIEKTNLRLPQLQRLIKEKKGKQ